jgi:hypothetical protein
MRVAVVSLALLALCSSSACTFSSAVAYGPPAPPRAPQQVRVLAASDPGRPFEVVGLVVSQQDTSDPRELMMELRRLAAAMGADAVVDLRLSLGFGVWNVGHHVTGTAVRYR